MAGVRDSTLPSVCFCNNRVRYGLFTALSCAGSITGAIAYSARIGHLYGVYAYRDIELRGNLSPTQFQQVYALRAQELRFCAAHFASHPLESGVVIIAQLLVLHRMQKFALTNSLRERAWLLAARLLLAAVIFGVLVGVVSNIVAAVFYSQAAHLSSEASSAYATNSSSAGAAMFQQAQGRMSLAVRFARRQLCSRAPVLILNRLPVLILLLCRTASIQRFTEMAILLMIVAAFLIVGVYSLRIIASAIRTLMTAEQKLVEISSNANGNGDRHIPVHMSPLNHNPDPSRHNIENSLALVAKASQQGIDMQHKVAFTFVWIFLTILTRAVFIVFYGTVMAGQDFDNACSPDQCNPCKNVFAHMNFWILYTPSLQHTVMLVVSPLSLLVALWGMSDLSAIEQMSSSSAKLRQRFRMMRR